MQRGFTLLELLLVCALVGILSATGLGISRTAIDRAKVGEASAQVVADLQRARSAAQRYNQRATLAVAASDLSHYTLTINTTPVTKLSKALPPGIRFEKALSVAYYPPFGEVDTTTAKINLRFPDRSVKDRQIKIVGVTGKVLYSELP